MYQIKTDRQTDNQQTLEIYKQIHISFVIAQIEELQDDKNPSKKPERSSMPKEKDRLPDPNRWFREPICAGIGVTPPTLDKSLKSLRAALTVEDMPVIRAKDRQIQTDIWCLGSLLQEHG
jgi:hypothetical protein